MRPDFIKCETCGRCYKIEVDTPKPETHQYLNCLKVTLVSSEISDQCDSCSEELALAFAKEKAKQGIESRITGFTITIGDKKED